METWNEPQYESHPIFTNLETDIKIFVNKNVFFNVLYIKI